MIKITSLNKIYRSKKRRKCHALNDINLTLPDAGLVFVLGKSGSGKSTLLNLIGGLDNITSGSVEVDGNDLAKFKEKDFCNYRNSHIGFIFQDYHLIDELTVYENIRLSLDLENRNEYYLIGEALARVDLAGYEERYPTELSGGEQQRVAIARAIVKKPRIILADEPTGNLDTNTARQIVELLKELSKDCLILIVSHNINDANNYADRIIELKKGRIISDKSRNPEFLDEVSLQNGELVYPQGLALSDNDIDFINNNLTKFKKKTDKFLPTAEPKSEARKVKIPNKNLSLGRELNLSGKFLKSKTLAISFSAFMVAVIMVIMALAQTIIAFDGGEIIENEMDKMDETSLFMLNTVSSEEKELIGENAQDFYVDISDDEIQKFRDFGYDGDIYKVYNLFMPIKNGSSNLSAGWHNSFFSVSPYLKALTGVISVDEEFLVSKFGKVEYLAKLDEFHPGGIVITDYVADAIRSHNSKYINKSYDELLGKYLWGDMNLARGYINGIIKTGYKEEFKELFESFNNGEITSDTDLSKNEDYLRFCSEVYSTLGFGYSFEEDFEASYENNYPCDLLWHHKLYFDNLEYVTIFSPQVWVADDLGIALAENEILLPYGVYNEVFGTNYTAKDVDSFVPHDVNLSHYRYYDYACENPLFTMNVRIAGITTHDSGGTHPTIIVSDKIATSFAKDSIMIAGLYFDGNKDIDTVIDTANELGFTPYASAVEGIHTMTKAVDVFIPIFELIAIFLCVGVIFILVNFSSKMINDKMHEIGILKALGTKNSSIGAIFGLQVALIAILTCILATAGYYFFIDLANDVLIESLMRLAPSHVVLDLDFLTFQPKIALENCVLVGALALISLIFPMVKIKAIKPVKIIKAKD